MTTLKMQDARDYEYDRAIVTFIESKAVTDFAVKYGIFVEHQKENPTTCVSVHLYGNRSAVVVQTSKVLAKKIQLLAKRASQEENAALERDIADNTALLTTHRSGHHKNCRGRSVTAVRVSLLKGHGFCIG